MSQPSLSQLSKVLILRSTNTLELEIGADARLQSAWPPPAPAAASPCSGAALWGKKGAALPETDPMHTVTRMILPHAHGYEKARVVLPERFPAPPGGQPSAVWATVLRRQGRVRRVGRWAETSQVRRFTQ